MRRVKLLAIAVCVLTAMPAFGLEYFTPQTIEQYVEKYGKPRAYDHAVPGITIVWWEPEPGTLVGLHVDAETLVPIGETALKIGDHTPPDRKYWPQYDLVVNREALRPKKTFNELSSRAAGTEVEFTFADGTMLSLNSKGYTLSVYYPGYDKHRKPRGWVPKPGPIPPVLRQWLDENGNPIPEVKPDYPSSGAEAYLGEP